MYLDLFEKSLLKSARILQSMQDKQYKGYMCFRRNRFHFLSYFIFTKLAKLSLINCQLNNNALHCNVKAPKLSKKTFSL